MLYSRLQNITNNLISRLPSCFSLVKKILSDAVDSENKKVPFTDEKLMNLLRDRGYNIARRTVLLWSDAIPEGWQEHAKMVVFPRTSFKIIKKNESGIKHYSSPLFYCGTQRATG